MTPRPASIERAQPACARASISVVFPDPGPPVTTNSRCVSLVTGIVSLVTACVDVYKNYVSQGRGPCACELSVERAAVAVAILTNPLHTGGKTDERRRARCRNSQARGDRVPRLLPAQPADRSVRRARHPSILCRQERVGVGMADGY